MRKRFVFSLVVLALVVSGAGNAILAQDAMDKVVCDSDLVLSLYTAEYYLGFGAVIDQLAADGMPVVDVSAIDKGPYAPAFDAMMGMMDASMAMENGAVTADVIAAVVEAMGMPMEEMMGMMEMPEGATALVPVSVEGEPQACTDLRAELNHFYQSLIYVNEQMMMAAQ
jgi:hypothetical protein